VRGHLHSASLQKFFTNKTHKKYCENCGKPSALLLERCSYCGEALSDSQIAAMARDPLLEAVLDAGSSDFDELYRSFELLVLKHRYPVGREHLLVMPKDTCYDLRQLRRRQVPFLKKMYQKAIRLESDAAQQPPPTNSLERWALIAQQAINFTRSPRRVSVALPHYGDYSLRNTAGSRPTLK
ncbi:unnamed protein product, partial [Symbiodinium sp. KB8]